MEYISYINDNSIFIRFYNSFNWSSWKWFYVYYFFIVSADNTDNILLDQLGESKSYLDRCKDGDGQITEELGLNKDQTKSFDDIKTAKRTFEETKPEFEKNKQYVTYFLYLNEIKTSFEGIHKERADLLVEYSGVVDE